MYKGIIIETIVILKEMNQSSQVCGGFLKN